MVQRPEAGSIPDTPGSYQFKDIDFPFTIKLGFEYNVVENFFLRLGVNTEPTVLSFGLGYQLKNKLRIDFASSYYQELGFTPAISFGYDLGKK